jgi:hypothetical protein
MEELLRDIDEESPPTKRPRGPGYLWNESSRIEVTESTRNVQDLDNMFKLFIGTDSRLKVARSPISSHLKKVYGWRCKSKACNKQKRISKLLPGHPNTAPGKYTYILEETFGDHTCETEPTDQPKGILTTEMKERIDECLRNGKTEPRQIMTYFRAQEWALPTSKQITNYKSRLNSPKPNESTTTGQMSEWCQLHTKTDDHDKVENEDKAFVVNYVVDHNNKTFRLGISTMRLLRVLSSQYATGEPIMLHSDATYKINLESYPGTLYGSSDKHRRFHLHLFGLSWSETEDDYDFFFQILKVAMGWTHDSLTKLYLMMDDAPAIHNGAKRQFPTIIRCMCFAHVYMNMRDTHLSFARGDDMLQIKHKFLKDLVHVACSWSKACFELALSLMCDEYSNTAKYGVKMHNAAEHLRGYWGNESRCGWYSGFMPTCVRNNNGLESMWKYFKTDCTTYKRCNLIILLRRVITWIETISGSYAYNIPEADRRHFRRDPTTSLTRGEWEAAYHFAMDVRDKKRYRFFSTPNAEKTYVFLPILNSTQEEEQEIPTEEETEAGQRMEAIRKFHQWETLDNITTFKMFTSLLHETHIVSYIRATKFYYCTCYHFCKTLSCYHTICVRRHVETIGFQWPDGIRPGAFERRRGDTRKPGRPKIYPQRTSKYTRNGEYDYFPELPDK